MSSSALCRAPVPSKAVLRFLKAQSESLSGFASSGRQRTTRTPCGKLDGRHSYYTRMQPVHSTRLQPVIFQRHDRTAYECCTTIRPTLPPCRPQHRSFSTTLPRPQPREVASRTSPTDKWHLRRPPPPPPSSYPSASPLSVANPSSALLNYEDHALGPRLTKPNQDQRLRCTEFDEAGNVTLVNGEFRKSELIQKYGLQPRDLRKIDSSLLPTILVRPKAILLNLLHIRCLIQADRVLVFDVLGSTDSYTQSLFMYDLEGKLSLREGRGQGQLPYEFRALEAVLISVTTALEGEFHSVRGPVLHVLGELEENIDRDKLRLLLVLSKKIGTFEQRARLVRDAIDELLEADDDLAAMYLTEKKEGKVRDDEDHTEVEMLLESYDKVCDEIVQSSGNIVTDIRNTEEIVKAILDANRNSLMLLDLKFSIGTLGIGAGTFIAALYGMNLKSFIEEWDFGFPLVSATCAVFTVVACVYGFRKLRKVQRLSMWGEGNLGERGIMNGRKPQKPQQREQVAQQRWEDFEGRQEPSTEWRGLDNVADRVSKTEKGHQWRTAERLRRLRLLGGRDDVSTQG